MTNVFLASGLVTVALLLALDGLDRSRSNARRWIASRSRLLPGVIVASVAVLAADAIAQDLAGTSRTLAWAAPVAVVGMVVLVLAAYPRGGR